MTAFVCEFAKIRDLQVPAMLGSTTKLSFKVGGIARRPLLAAHSCTVKNIQNILEHLKLSHSFNRR